MLVVAHFKVKNINAIGTKPLTLLRKMMKKRNVRKTHSIIRESAKELVENIGLGRISMRCRLSAALLQIMVMDDKIRSSKITKMGDRESYRIILKK